MNKLVRRNRALLNRALLRREKAANRRVGPDLRAGREQDMRMYCDRIVRIAPLSPSISSDLRPARSEIGPYRPFSDRL